MIGLAGARFGLAATEAGALAVGAQLLWFKTTAQFYAPSAGLAV